MAYTYPYHPRAAFERTVSAHERAGFANRHFFDHVDEALQVFFAEYYEDAGRPPQFIDVRRPHRYFERRIVDLFLSLSGRLGAENVLDHRFGVVHAIGLGLLRLKGRACGEEIEDVTDLQLVCEESFRRRASNPTASTDRSGCTT
jgi:hypothetical protein